MSNPRRCATTSDGAFIRGGVDKAVTNRLTLATDIQLQHVDVSLANPALTLPDEGVDFDFGPNGLTWYHVSNIASSAMTGKFNVWGNMLATFTGIVPLKNGGLTDNFTPIIGLDYAW